MNRGWVPFERQELAGPLGRVKPTSLRVYLELLTRAAFEHCHAEGPRGARVQIRKGQLLCTVAGLVEATGLARDTCMKALVELERAGKIRRQTMGSGTLVTVNAPVSALDVSEKPTSRLSNNPTALMVLRSKFSTGPRTPSLFSLEEDQEETRATVTAYIHGKRLLQSRLKVWMTLFDPWWRTEWITGKKAGKEAARKAWGEIGRKYLDKMTPQQLLKNVTTVTNNLKATEWRGTARKYLPRCSTHLRAESFATEDVGPPVIPPAAIARKAIEDDPLGAAADKLHAECKRRDVKPGRLAAHIHSGALAAIGWHGKDVKAALDEALQKQQQWDNRRARG